MAEPQLVYAGAGSYLVGPPADAKTPTRTVYRGPDLVGPVPSSRWWSSLAWEPFSHPLYPHPLAMQVTAEGLDIGAPDVTVGTDAQFNSHAILAPLRPDLTIAVAAARFDQTTVAGHSDFAATFRWTNHGQALETTASHGSPYVYVLVDGGDARLAAHGPVEVWSDRGSTLGITVNGHPYGVFAPTGAHWRQDGQALSSTLDGHGYWTVALLPAAGDEVLDLFAGHAHAHVQDTRVTWTYDEPTAGVTARYEFVVTAKEGEADSTLFALYPHQWRALVDGEIADDLSYRTVRGTMRLMRGTGFTVTHPVPGMLTHLPLLGNETAELAELVAEARDEGDHHLAHLYPHGARDMYWTGVSLGRATALVPYAERVGDERAVKELVGWLKSTLEEHFTATGPDGQIKTAALFWYDPVWHTVIGHPGGFGADEALNDHHYQYAYFIRAAVEVARHDPEWVAPDRWGPMVDLLVRDIATIEADDMFPRLRHFDLYAGHSWATGRNEFDDGANAESVSESIAASSAILLWGEMTGDRALRDLGAFLYATEVAAAEEYWHDLHQENFPPGFDRAMAGQIWGGKTSCSTWWTDDPEAMRGISFLPLTPASYYLGRNPDYVRRNLADLRLLRPEWSYWPDIFWCYEALADPGEALRRRAEHGPYVMGHTESHAHTLGWILDLDTLGNVDPTVVADTPASLVFRRSDGVATYLASNLTLEAREVRFCDGTTLTVSPRSTTRTVIRPAGVDE